MLGVRKIRRPILQPSKSSTSPLRHTEATWLRIHLTRCLPTLFLVITFIPCMILIRTSLFYTLSSPGFTKDASIQTTHHYRFENEMPQLDFNQTARKILTLYVQHDVLDSGVSTPTLREMKFPQMGISSCTDRNVLLPKLPIDEFPNTDPFLPWIHDYHINYPMASEVRFIAQNKRRCYTGIGMEAEMKHWEPQIALFQPISIREENLTYDAGTSRAHKIQYRLSSPDNATYRETRFLCHFHSVQTDDINQSSINATTLSTYFFNYEYVAWRKNRANLPMYKVTGKDVSNFMLSQLLFKCPVPTNVRNALLQTADSTSNIPLLYLDVVPIRTLPRYTRIPLLTADMVGPRVYEDLKQDPVWLNASASIRINDNTIVPEIQRSGRYANLPLCSPAPGEMASTSNNKRYHLVACTWTSASYYRRGDATLIADASARLLEWILFHKLAGIDHIYLYDNTPVVSDALNGTNPIYTICQSFPDYVTYISFPASICNNNRPNHKNPGERSSQYAAEASCRSRFGDATEWMTFLDTDEYIVPMAIRSKGVANRNDSHIASTTWHEVLQTMEQKGYQILKMSSSRGRPRVELMETTDVCDNTTNQFSNDSCLVPQRNETYLRVYKYVYIMFSLSTQRSNNTQFSTHFFVTIDQLLLPCAP
jgi:Glycosyltransferase family 92